jgi:D-xylose transport system ATP-binding protein
MTILRDGRTVATARTADLTPARVISLMVGREVAGLYPRPAPPGDAIVLSVRDWSVADADNPGRNVVRDVSFDLHAGEVLGIAGLMGAGRTALLSSLFGVARGAVAGTLERDGRASGAYPSPGDAIHAGIGLVSEDRQRFGLVPAGSVMDNLTLASLSRRVWHGLVDEEACRRDCTAQVEGLRIRTPGLDAPVSGLSGGNQQKVVLGRWLMVAPRVLLLDEPTRGIDVGAKAELYGVIRRLAEEGLGILLVTSELPELLGLSHRVIVLHAGAVTARLDAGEATPERVMAAAAMPA